MIQNARTPQSRRHFKIFEYHKTVMFFSPNAPKLPTLYYMVHIQSAI